MMKVLDALFGAKEKYKEVRPDELSALDERVRIIDVRQPAEFDGDLGHLDAAELVPLGTLANVAPSWPKDAPLLVVCRSGGRSSRACSVLAGLGFTDVTNLKGGMLAVRAQGR